MREILFRGKRIDNGRFIIGALMVYDMPSGEKAVIVTGFAPLSKMVDCESVDISTIGQFTGLTDKSGKQIFEGDVVSYLWGQDLINFIIKFEDGEFLAFPIGFDATDKESPSVWPITMSSYAKDFAIVGNIYDNPELLKGGPQK